MKWRNKRYDFQKQARFWNQWNVDRASKIIYFQNFIIIPRLLWEQLKKQCAEQKVSTDILTQSGFKVVIMGPEHAMPLPNRRQRKNARWRAKCGKSKPINPMMQPQYISQYVADFTPIAHDKFIIDDFRDHALFKGKYMNCFL